MDTIAAISTSIGNSGINIIRISGSDSLKILYKIFKRPNNKIDIEPNTIKYGKIYDNNEIVDEVLVSYFETPFSYTGEDICEINSHGGIVISKRILNLIIKNGARLAEPGEFTKRAFLNGKIDLSQAEAIMDLINSKSIKENKISVNQLEGNLGKKIREIYTNIIDILGDIEAEIDYPEYDLEEVKREKIHLTINKSIKELQNLEKSFESGKIIKDGINVSIVGKPNVGKSSLLNCLLDEERAIVTDIAGTTRDTIEESFILDGIPINIVDTAGIRETKDVIEKIGVEKSKKAIEKSDLVLMLFDSTDDKQNADSELFDAIKEKKVIFLINKIDKNNSRNDIINKIIKENFNNPIIVEISAKNNIGIDDLKNKIIELFNLNQIEYDNNIVITNERHIEAILKTIENLKLADKTNDDGLPLDMVSVALKNSIDNLKNITGENVTDDIIDNIFSKFCLGK